MTSSWMQRWLSIAPQISCTSSSTKPIFKTSASISFLLFMHVFNRSAIFYYGLNKTAVPWKSGTVQIPKDAAGQTYVILSSSQNATDATTLAGPGKFILKFVVGSFNWLTIMLLICFWFRYSCGWSLKLVSFDDSFHSPFLLIYRSPLSILQHPFVWITLFFFFCESYNRLTTLIGYQAPINFTLHQWVLWSETSLRNKYSRRTNFPMNLLGFFSYMSKGFDTENTTS